MDFRNLSQKELATIMGKDRTTIRAWTVAGMPYKKPVQKGMKASFDSAHCVHWCGGHWLAETNGLELRPLEKVAVGWLIGSGCAENGRVSKEDERLYLGIMKRAGIGREQALRLLEFARGVITQCSY